MRFWNRPFAFYQLFHKPYLDFLAFYLSPWAFYSSIDYLSCNYIEDIFTPLEAEEFYPSLNQPRLLGVFWRLADKQFQFVCRRLQIFYLWIFLFLMVCVIFLQPLSASYHHFSNPEKNLLRLSTARVI